jgi:hypothetical protein
MNTVHRKVIKAISNPKSAIDFVGAQAYRRLAEKEFVAQVANRSESEGGTYVAFVRKAVRSYKVFGNFRRHHGYREVLEQEPEMALNRTRAPFLKARQLSVESLLLVPTKLCYI